MLSLKAFLYIYLFGGITFIPLVVLLVLFTAWYTLPKQSTQQIDFPPRNSSDPALLVRPDDSDLNLKTSTDSLAEKFHRKHESDVAAGYFAVVREYVPGGVNGKPPERVTPAGEIVAQESPSVYQTMYRSLFERKDRPSVEPKSDAAGRPVKKTTGNVFYIVLRHGHLMLYDDDRQLEVRYVISLEYHDVDIYAGAGEIIAESELWIKRNAIRLSRRAARSAAEKMSLPFFLFSENLSEKEDFYFALLRNMKRDGAEALPEVLDFETRDIITLVQRLHSTEEHLQTRWLNALIGRMFLAMYKTQKLEQIIRKKLTKKIARVKKPGFITKLALQTIDTGTAAPFVTNPRLKDLTVNGDCTVEADVEYSGNFRIEIAATVRIDLGKRLGAREVDLVLAVTCKKLSGHVLLRFKPPPSNRVWVTFDKVPKVELALEPIVSSRQITYGFILRAMESRIMEVIAETIVLPFWDDIPFLDTSEETYRGGVWKHDSKPQETTEIKDEVAEDEAEAGSGGEGTKTPDPMSKAERIMSMPAIAASGSALTAARGAAKQKSMNSMREGTEGSGTKTPEHTKPRDVPRVMRSSSFASAADPMVSPSHAPAHSPVLEPEATSKRDSMLKDLSARSLGTSPEAPSEDVQSSSPGKRSRRNISDASELSLDAPVQVSRQSSDETSTTLHPSGTVSRTSTTDTLDSKRSSKEESKLKGFAATAKSMAGDREKAMASINTAREAAQKWGWGVLAARNRARDGEPKSPAALESKPPPEPMGRGQPLPPPGTPLPRPPKPGLFSMPKRQSISKPGTAANGNSLASSGVATPTSEQGSGSPPKPQPPPLPERRRRQSAMQQAEEVEDEILVVEAPTESAPTSPLPIENEHHDEFFGHGEEMKEKSSIAEEHEQGEQESEEVSKKKPQPPPLPARPEVPSIAGEHEQGEQESEKVSKKKPEPPALPARPEVPSF